MYCIMLGLLAAKHEGWSVKAGYLMLKDSMYVQIRQKLANTGVFVMRTVFDRATSYNLEGMSEKKWLRRILFLETIAGKNC